MSMMDLFIARLYTIAILPYTIAILLSSTTTIAIPSLLLRESYISPLVANCDDPNVADNKEVAEVVKLLDQACREAGLFYVGYQRVGENITKGIPDRHEAIDCYRELKKGMYGGLGDPLVGISKWPSDPPRFKELMEEYLVLCTCINNIRIAMALGGSVDEFEGKIADDPFWVFRIIDYPGSLSINEEGFPKNDVGWAGAAEGAIDAANILKPALARVEVQVGILHIIFESFP
ncbi:hypothetical protein L2E82_07276 [Cichorium intybus]|uniref:Uncharacterized protein n=1 Tax=Cichorium intybus TaxID=13427 RepID=A0ACB9G521_CICIN|nr:hypothetical protein L2E82_07276 [Cichorium intybus]